MARTPRDPSGATQQITLRLSPAHLTKLDRLAEVQGLTRATMIERLLDRVDEEAPEDLRAHSDQISLLDDPAVHTHDWRKSTGASGVLLWICVGCGGRTMNKPLD